MLSQFHFIRVLSAFETAMRLKGISLSSWAPVEYVLNLFDLACPNK